LDEFVKIIDLTMDQKIDLWSESDAELAEHEFEHLMKGRKVKKVFVTANRTDFKWLLQCPDSDTLHCPEYEMLRRSCPG
jgi:hypothetical protein